jgi:ligand-binding sensor domain-containing protein/anti-sigma regulatory factor (Ser/Thr protein kinase)
LQQQQTQDVIFKQQTYSFSRQSFYCATLLLFFLFLLPRVIVAQQYTFIEYNLKEGLPQSQVRCMMQDSRGFFWIGTLGGLSRFDGRSFKNYDRQEGLMNNQANCVIELNDGTIVVGSNGSFSFINGLGVKSVSLGLDHEESTINALFELDDKLWIGTEDGMLIYSLREEKMSDEKINTSIASAHIKTFLKRKNGDLLILTKSECLRKSGVDLIPFFRPDSSDVGLFDIVESADESLWLASKGMGLIHLSLGGALIENFTDQPGFPTNTITGVIIDKSNHVWLTSRYGFFEYDGNHFEAFTEKNGLKTPDVRDMLVDKEGNIWIGTYGNGILKFTGKTFSSYTTKDGLSSDAVMSIAQDLQGDLWFSTFDKGICQMTADSMYQFKLDEWTNNNRIWSSLTDHTGAMWFGSSDGLFKYENGKFSLYTEEDSLSNTMVLALFEDSKNRIWIGTNKGLTVFENNHFIKVNQADAPQKKVRCIRQDKSGNLWFAAIDGVFRYDGSAFKLYSQKDGLSENSTNSIEIDEFDRVWVGSQNGIALLSSSQFLSSQIGENSGSNVINFLKYADARMWIGTNNGLYSVNVFPTMDERKLSFRHYGLEDGLRSLETNLNSVFIDNNNRIWFGTIDGATNLNTSFFDKKREEHIPLLNLTNIQINLLNMDWGKDFDQRSVINGLPIQPIFNYKQNHLTFYFTAISTTYPGDVKFQYMLDGLDDDWKPATKADFATYSNLPYKSFTFKVRASGANGIWSEPVMYSFAIQPPFWLRWWFILFEVILISSIIGYVLFNKRKAALAKREKESFEIRSKMLALEQQSLNSSMNRHFIFNALNSIQYYINRQDRIAANRYLSDFARLIRKNLDSSQDNLTTLRDEIERLELYLKLEHMRFKDKFEYKINVDPTLNLDQVKVPAMLVQPFLENSIWHGLLPKESPGFVIVDIKASGESLEMIITDNGIGIENSLKNKTTADTHISKGMEITQNRIELIKKMSDQVIELRGPSQISTGEGSEGGTQVVILLPLNFHELFRE